MIKSENGEYMKKELGQVWTPQWMVERMLDKVEFTVENISEKIKHNVSFSIFEPSFGDGVFLFEILKRIKKAAINNNKSLSEIQEIINSSIYGVEIDEDVFNKTITNIRLQNPDMDLKLNNLKNSDFLVFAKNALIDNMSFDYIVGNPPYIRVHDLPIAVREQLKELSTTTGTTDLYIAFYEQCIKLLSIDASLIFIAPNSWQKNTSQKAFRKSLLDARIISEIEDYMHHQVFKDASTYVSVVHCKNHPQDSFDVCNISSINDEGKVVVADSHKIRYDLNSDNTLSLSEIVEKSISADNEEEYVFLGDICDVQNGIATLRDKSFLIDSIDNFTDEDKKYIRSCVKGSKYTGNEKGFVIFPYKSEDGKVVQISEEELKKAKNIYNHLLSDKENLEKRSSDKSALWFHYGRSQAIQKTPLEKIVVSSVVSSEATVNNFLLEKDTVVYSGLFIIEKTSNEQRVSLEKISQIISTQEFSDHVRKHGKNMRGNYTSFSAPVAKKFKVRKDLLRTDN